MQEMCIRDSRKTDEMLQEFDYRLQSQGLNLDLYMKYTGFSADTFKETYKEQALNQVKIRLALEEIVKLEKIEVTEEEPVSYTHLPSSFFPAAPHDFPSL